MKRSLRKQTRDELRSVVRAARWRWRLRIAVTGLALTLACATAAVLLSGWAVDRLAFSATSLLVFRVLVWALVAGVATRWLVLPLARRVSDQQVALYLEEHEPTLGAALVSAMEVSDDDVAERSPAFDHRLIEAALARLRAGEEGRRVERPGLLRGWGLLTAASVVALVLFGMAPTGVRQGAGAVLKPWTPAAEANPYSVAVLPGDTVIARGADLAVRASLVGFAAEQVELLVRREGETG
ncbi:MAG TPA: hypothetical protein VMK65_11470, partial [Longimicrobiales bacterium]|nr:hypothetical protein [Longimicrobiales bacterium]